MKTYKMWRLLYNIENLMDIIYSHIQHCFMWGAYTRSIEWPMEQELKYIPVMLQFQQKSQGPYTSEATD